MVDAGLGKIFIIFGVIVNIIGMIVFFVAMTSFVPFLFTMFILIINGGVGLITLGIIIHFVGDKYINCPSCGLTVKDDVYICPSCNVKTSKYYHQKVFCRRCGKKTHYDEYSGRCKYCGNALYLP